MLHIDSKPRRQKLWGTLVKLPEMWCIWKLYYLWGQVTVVQISVPPLVPVVPSLN